MIYLINTIIKVVCKLGLISAEEILLCADIVKNRMDVVVKEAREEMKTEFANVSFISCTTDHWFEAYNNQDYMTITVQYYDSKSHKLATRVIGTFAVEDKTGEITIKYFAMWILSTPATSCSSERNFSAAGFILSHRNRLKLKLLMVYCCLDRILI